MRDPAERRTRPFLQFSLAQMWLTLVFGTVMFITWFAYENSHPSYSFGWPCCNYYKYFPAEGRRFSILPLGILGNLIFWYSIPMGLCWLISRRRKEQHEQQAAQLLQEASKGKWRWATWAILGLLTCAFVAMNLVNTVYEGWSYGFPFTVLSIWAAPTRGVEISREWNPGSLLLNILVALEVLWVVAHCCEDALRRLSNKPRS